MTQLRVLAVPPLPLQKEFAQRVAEIREKEAGRAENRRSLGAVNRSQTESN